MLKTSKFSVLFPYVRFNLRLNEMCRSISLTSGDFWSSRCRSLVKQLICGLLCAPVSRGHFSSDSSSKHPLNNRHQWVTCSIIVMISFLSHRLLFLFLSTSFSPISFLSHVVLKGLVRSRSLAIFWWTDNRTGPRIPQNQRTGTRDWKNWSKTG